jgi:hypothetical protein
LRTSGIEPAQRLEGVIEFTERLSARIGGSDLIEVQRRCALDSCGAAATLLRRPGPGGVHEDAAHQLCREREEMRAIVPVGDPDVDQA